MPIDNIKLYLEEAKKVSQLPEEETEVLNLEMEMETIGFIKGVAAAWHCEVNDVIVATLIAIVNSKPQTLEDLTS